jgi:predicted transcriptional regulator
MRFILCLLGLYLFAAGMGQESIVRRITDTGWGKEMASSGVIGTNSGLILELDMEQLKRYVNLEKLPSIKADYEELQRIQTALTAGEKALADYYANQTHFAPGRLATVQDVQSFLNPINLAYVTLYNPQQQGALKERIEAAVDRAAIEMQREVSMMPQLSQVYLMSAAFREAAEYAREKAFALSQTMRQIAPAGVTIRLRHFREQDDTRRREIRFLEELNGNDRQILDRINEWAERYGRDPEQVYHKTVEELVAQAKEIAKSLEATYNEKKTEIIAAYDDLQEKLSGSTDDSLEELRERYSKLKQQFDLLKDKLEKVLTRLQSGNYDLSNPATGLQQLINDVNPIRDLYRLWQDTVTLAKEIKIQSTGNIQQAAEAVIDKVNGALTAMKESFEKAVGLLVKLPETMLSWLNLRNTFQQIGEIIEPAAPRVEFKNVDGRLGILPRSLVSGDEVTLEVFSPTNESLFFKRLYAYKMGWRTDRLFSAIFTERVDKSAWRIGAAYSDVFKNGTRKSLEANRLMSIGLGVTVATLDQNADDSFELGLGAALSFLDDRLIAGYGYNLGLNRSFVYFGLRLQLGR